MLCKKQLQTWQLRVTRPLSQRSLGQKLGYNVGWLLGPKYHQAKTEVLSGSNSHLETSDSHLPPHASLCLAEFWSWPRWDRRAIPLLAGCGELPLAHRRHPVLCHLLPFILRVSVRASNLTQSLETSHLLQPEERRLFEGLMVSLTQHDLFLRAKLPSDSQCRGVLPRMGLHSNFCFLLNCISRVATTQYHQSQCPTTQQSPFHSFGNKKPDHSPDIGVHTPYKIWVW